MPSNVQRRFTDRGLKFILGHMYAEGRALASRGSCSLPGMALTLMPTWVLWASVRARRSLLPLLGPRKLLRNLVLYFRLSPHTPHCQACLLSRPGESSQVQRSMRPALQARASACVRAAADIAYRKAVSLKPVQEERKLRGHLQPFEGRSGVGWMVGRVKEWEPKDTAV